MYSFIDRNFQASVKIILDCFVFAFSRHSLDQSYTKLTPFTTRSLVYDLPQLRQFGCLSLSSHWLLKAGFPFLHSALYLEKNTNYFVRKSVPATVFVEVGRPGWNTTTEK